MRNLVNICEALAPAIGKLDLPEDTWTEVKIIVKIEGANFRVAGLAAVVLKQDRDLPDYQYPVFSFYGKD